MIAQDPNQEMKFRLVKKSLVSIFGKAENKRYQTIGFQRQGVSAEEAVGCNRLLTVFYNSGDFPKGSSSRQGPVSHDIQFGIGLMLAEPAVMDLAILKRAGVTSEEIAAAIMGSQSASDRADDHMDEFIQIVFQILMDAANQDLGLPIGTVSNTWVGSVNKQQPIPNGQYVALGAQLTFGCRVSEKIFGDVPVTGTVENPIVFNTVTDLADDENAKTGVITKTN